MKTTLEIQRQLKMSGLDPGPLDNQMGPLTRNAILRFQMTNAHLRDTGFPDAETLAALFGEPVADEPVSLTPWMDLALTKVGLHEGRDNIELREFLRSDGKTLGDPAKLPWCGDFVETCIARTLAMEGLPTNPYLARNWLKFGIPCEPRYGAVAVYWRGKRDGTAGHVAFLVGEDVSAGAWINLGGNQGNTVSKSSLDKNRLLGFRWPSTVPMGKAGLPQMKAGKLSTDEA